MCIIRADRNKNVTKSYLLWRRSSRIYKPTGRSLSHSAPNEAANQSCIYTTLHIVFAKQSRINDALLLQQCASSFLSKYVRAHTIMFANLLPHMIGKHAAETWSRRAHIITLCAGEPGERIRSSRSHLFVDERGCIYESADCMRGLSRVFTTRGALFAQLDRLNYRFSPHFMGCGLRKKLLRIPPLLN